MTTQPEPSQSPEIYDFQDAVRFATAWSGLDSEMVENVLDAKFRYLELAGIAQCEVDEALLREREVYRHLLPETPDFIDERETQYLVQVTGLKEETVLRICQGELAYQDSLSILSWGDDEERDANLGAPELPEEETLGDFDPEGKDDPMFEGHGEHWECVVPDVAPFIEPHLDEMPGTEHLRFHVPSPFPRWEGVTARAVPQAVNLETLRLDGDRNGESEIISAFPVARDGAIHSLTLHRARPWKVDCEAIAIASTSFGASIAYFDTSFLHPWNEWGPDEEQDIALAAFAYNLEPAPIQVIPITQEDKVRAMRAIEQGVKPEEVTDLSPIEVRTEGMACFFPLRGGNPDEFDFQGPVVGVDILRAWGQTLYRLDVTVMRDTTCEETIPFTIPVYVAQHKLPESYRPRVGDDVRGVLWLQGSVAGLKYPVISEG